MAPVRCARVASVSGPRVDPCGIITKRARLGSGVDFGTERQGQPQILTLGSEVDFEFRVSSWNRLGAAPLTESHCVDFGVALTESHCVNFGEALTEGDFAFDHQWLQSRGPL